MLKMGFTLIVPVFKLRHDDSLPINSDIVTLGREGRTPLRQGGSSAGSSQGGWFDARSLLLEFRESVHGAAPSHGVLLAGAVLLVGQLLLHIRQVWQDPVEGGLLFYLILQGFLRGDHSDTEVQSVANTWLFFVEVLRLLLETLVNRMLKSINCSRAYDVFRA